MERIPDKRYKPYVYTYKGDPNDCFLPEQTPMMHNRPTSQENTISDHGSALADLIASYVEVGNWALIVDLIQPMISEFRQAPRATKHLPYLYKAYIFSLLALGRSYHAASANREASDLYPRDPDLKMMEGDIFFTVGDYRRALGSFQTSWQMSKELTTGVCPQTWQTSSHRTARKLALSWLNLGDELSARDWLFRAYEEDPNQPGVVPLLVLLTEERALLADIEESVFRSGRQRYEEFVEYYAMSGLDNALQYIRRVETTWGESEASRRARFVSMVREGQTPHRLHFTANDSSHCVRTGLWYYEQGETGRALACWAEAGELGARLTDVVKTGVACEWRITGLLKEFMAANAVKFLADFAPGLKDCGEVMPILLQTSLMKGLQEDTYVNKSAFGSCAEQEWRAMVHMARGNWSLARQALVQASLPDGFHTVRGYRLQAELLSHQREDIYARARSVYPTSKLLSSAYKPDAHRMLGITH